MTVSEVRAKYLAFFAARGHAIIPSASLVPMNDPSVLFNTAGMQPLVPYLLGEPHPAGKRLADAQKCVRTVDIDEIGDNTHATFFEMLGNWSLGDYFKKEAIEWSHAFLTSKEEGLGLEPARLYVTIFGGNADAPKDTESYDIWRSLGLPENHIYIMDGELAEKNWWSPGPSGPCGPDTEMFYDVRGGLDLKNREEFLAADDRQEVVEIWNDVFMEYEKKEGKVIGKLQAKNVDTGSGLERVAMVVQGKKSIFEIDVFSNIMAKVRELGSSKSVSLLAERVISDHIRTSVFLIADGVTPSNTDQGYILRRLLRRAVRFADSIFMKPGDLLQVARVVQDEYKDAYSNVAVEHVSEVIRNEEEKFRVTLTQGIKEFERIAASGREVSASQAFSLFSSYGLPIDITVELAKEKGMTVDKNGFEEEFKKHQALSRAGAAQKFAGGLADHQEQTVRYHTAHHLLLKALQMVLGSDVHQRGSNITSERLRIDFSYGAKMTDEQKREVEKIVNEKIAESIPVVRTVMKKEEAEKLGAEHEFGATYPEMVSVYSVGALDNAFSIEFCGGPHVANTAELGEGGKIFKIQKEEASSAGVRRIKAVLE